jgi:hypothetical protein
VAQLEGALDGWVDVWPFGCRAAREAAAIAGGALQLEPHSAVILAKRSTA